jgi:hypothetical protein
MTDVQELAALGRAERGGSHRAGVLNLIQARIGALMTDPATMRDVLVQQGAVTLPSGETSTPILDVPGNRDAGENAVVGGNVTQRRDPNVALYFATELGVFMPRYVASGSVGQCLRDGALDYCPDCGRTNCGIDDRGRIAGDINACPARGTVPFARCNICGKRQYDTTVTNVHRELEAGELDVSALQATTPAQRLKAKLDIHQLAYHQDQARINGLMPMPTPSQVVGGRPPVGSVA